MFNVLGEAFGHCTCCRSSLVYTLSYLTDQRLIPILYISMNPGFNKKVLKDYTPQNTSTTDRDKELHLTMRSGHCSTVFLKSFAVN